MSEFIKIIVNVIIPIFLQIVVGFLLQKKFHLNTSTLAKLQFYIFLPALLFTNIFKASINASIFMKIIFLILILFFILLILSHIVSIIFKFPKRTRSAFVNSVVFFNSGNYCIPLLLLLYKDNEVIVLTALSVQVVIMLSQSILLNTFGIYNANAGEKQVIHSLIETLKMPIIYAVVFAILFRSLNLSVIAPIWNSLDSLSKGLVPLALVTLGAQLAETKIKFKVPKLYLSNFMRLIISPLLAFLLVKLFQIEKLDPVISQVIIIISGAPSAVNNVLLAIEYDIEPDLSSQIVFSSTVMSVLTISFIIGIVSVLFPI